MIERQTTFGGGKTHSLIALYYLASGVPAQDLPGISDALADEGLSLPSRVGRAVLVGQTIKPATPDPSSPTHDFIRSGGISPTNWVDDPVTRWSAPMTRQAPIPEALKTLFQEFGPANRAVGSVATAHHRQDRQPEEAYDAHREFRTVRRFGVQFGCGYED